tara:strand:- start:39870 stop:40475 length:606 start_codon:yes stop_codon:yes gene_type:complete
MMKTKKQILEVSRVLFNEKGVMNVTLRDVAKSMKRSYGNITYHYPTKEDVITRLFEEMNNELKSLQSPNDSSNLMYYLLELPKSSFDITVKYLFFTLDYNELKRNYSKFFSRVDTLNEERGKKWKLLLIHLRDEGFLKEELSNNDLDFIMFLSVSVRGTYFQLKENGFYNKTDYASILNQMLKPYLCNRGLTVLNRWLKSQ